MKGREFKNIKNKKCIIYCLCAPANAGLHLCDFVSTSDYDERYVRYPA